jgi:hypothetical protein
VFGQNFKARGFAAKLDDFDLEAWKNFCQRLAELRPPGKRWLQIVFPGKLAPSTLGGQDQRVYIAPFLIGQVALGLAIYFGCIVCDFQLSIAF